MTEKQYNVLRVLDPGPYRAKDVAALLGRNYDSTHKSLRRMEDREWVRRVNGKWELTRAGREAAGL